MAINIKECGISLYRYNLSHGQYFPIILIDVPYSRSEMNTMHYIEFTGQTTSQYLKGIDLGITKALPYWIQSPIATTPSGIANVFLEVYSDDTFFITMTVNNNGGVSNVNAHFTLNGNTYQTGFYTPSSSSSIDIIGATYNLVVFRTNDDYYFNLDSSSSYISSNNHGIDSSMIESSVVPGTAKGLYNPTNYIFLDFLRSTWTFDNNNTTKSDDIRTLLGKTKLIDQQDPIDNTPSSSGGGGGGGSNDIGGDPHTAGTTPTISALDSGLITLYSPTVAELQALGQFLWSDSFDVNTFKKLFNDPFDTILGLSIVPVKPTISGTHNIIFGNMDSGVSSSVVASQWVSIDCGSFTLNEVWNGALDYAPFTQISIYLPFIGVRQLNTNDVMGSTLHLYYRFDVLTGSCVAELTINHNLQGNKSGGISYNADMGSVYTFEGQCAVNIPLASQDFTNTIRAAISGVAVVSGTAASCATGHPALGLASLAIGTANTGIEASTPTVERSGHLSSSSAFLSSLEPCLFVNRPHLCKPQRYYALRGIPSQVYVSKLSSCTGYFQISDVQNIHASGASDSELDEIKTLLTQGVFVDSWS